MTVAVVGAGLAGLRTCEALRRHGYDAPIVLIGAEQHLPYTRPPLSKEILRGDAEPATATLRSAGDITGIGVELRLGRPAVAVDLTNHTVSLADGDEVRFDDLVIASGATPRTLPSVSSATTSLAGVHTLRTIDDAVALRDSLSAGTRVVVVGAGFIGLEVAASAQQRGCAVTVVDVLPVPLARVLDDAVGATIARLHISRGVEIRCGVGVAALVGDDRVERVTLSDGASVEADVVVVGIGVGPEVGWLADSGLHLDDGVVCDETLQAAPHVWAVGDVARWSSPSAGRLVRVEHWTNASEQPDHAARAICGDVGPFDPVPYFWTDHYDAKLQCLGFDTRGEETVVVRGSWDEPKWVALVRSRGGVGAVVGLRSPGAVMRLKPLLAESTPWDDAVAAASAGRI